METHMLEYAMKQPEGILVLRPSAPLSKEDFSGPSAAADAYLSEHAKLRGVLIHSKGFPGWGSFGGFTAHMRFVREHHKEVERVAIVTDSHFADMAERLGTHFTSAEVRHFPFSEEAKALAWLEGA